MIALQPASAHVADAAALGLRQARRVVVALVGATLLALGTALLFLPGPGSPVILLGLAVLGAEFAWARRWLKRVEQGFRDVRAGGARAVLRMRRRDDC
jgi:tellurite resistance protein TerC